MLIFITTIQYILITMKFLICPDSFKDCMSATEASLIMNKAIASILPNAIIKTIPLSDGGQGFIKSILAAINGELIVKQVCGPLGKPVTASYALIDDAKTAVIESAQAAGLELLTMTERNPLYTTTYGIGQLILDAIHKGAKKIILGLGGSATVDGGAGMLQALGAKLLDKNFHDLQPGGLYLNDLQQINFEHLLTNLATVEILIASDVINPLLGPNGAARVFGPQKGATPEMVEILEKGLSKFAQLCNHRHKTSLSDIPGSGAAGGLGYALLLLGGRIVSGIDLISNVTDLEQEVCTADIVFSGEGSLDSQTINGKTISKIAKLCKKYNKPLIVVAGRTSEKLEDLYTLGISAILPIAIVHGPECFEVIPYSIQKKDLSGITEKLTAIEYFFSLHRKIYPELNEALTSGPHDLFFTVQLIIRQLFSSCRL